MLILLAKHFHTFGHRVRLKRLYGNRTGLGMKFEPTTNQSVKDFCVLAGDGSSMNNQ